MSREELEKASALVEQAGASAEGEAAERLADLSDQLSDLAARDRGPDHGRLARLLTALSEVKEAVDGETGDTIERAREEITAYREGVEGV